MEPHLLSCSLTHQESGSHATKPPYWPRCLGAFHEQPRPVPPSQSVPRVDARIVMLYNLASICLQPHETARTKASATALLSAGSIVLGTPALSTALIASEKGRRCDYCHSVPVGGRGLSKCSGCAAYWYCGTVCANVRPRVSDQSSSSLRASRSDEAMARAPPQAVQAFQSLYREPRISSTTTRATS